jgi:hypothetical protein
VRAGFHPRQRAPHRVQRYRCCLCRRHFSDQTFRTSYWLKRADLLAPVFAGLVAGSGFRQLARSFEVAPHTIATHSARLGRHCLLFHQRHRPRGPLAEPLVLDSFQSFEHSHYSPTLFHALAGQDSHFVHGFTENTEAWRAWVPATALASAALVAVLLWRMPAPESPVAADAARVDATLEPVELLAAGEDLDLVENDLAFYQWLDATEFAAAGSAG